MSASMARPRPGAIYNVTDDEPAPPQTVIEHAAALTGLHLRELLREMLDQPLQSLRGENYELVRVVLSEALINRDLASAFRTGLLTPMLAGTLEVLRRRGDLRADPEDAVRLLSSLVLGLLLQAALGDEELQETWAVLPDRLADLLVGGLA